MSALTEAAARVRASRLASSPVFMGYLSGLVAQAGRYHERIDAAEARVRTICTIVDEDPEPIIKEAAGNPWVLEEVARQVASADSSRSLAALSSLASLASELADA